MRSFLLVLLFAPSLLLGAEYSEPKPGSAERTAIMEAMRRPVSKHVGQRVTFTGSVRLVENWASFHGKAAPTDGKPPRGDVAFELELDCFALLRRVDSDWKVLHWGFAGDVGVVERALKNYPHAPKALFSFGVE
jgi:hypothetical protein